MVDVVIAYLAHIRERSPSSPIPNKAEANFSKPLLLDPKALDYSYEELYTHFITPFTDKKEFG